MRLLLRHMIQVLLVFFVLRLFLQATSHESGETLPKSVLLSQLSEYEPIPSRALGPALRKVREQSEGLINRQISARYSQ